MDLQRDQLVVAAERLFGAISESANVRGFEVFAPSLIESRSAC
jgi:hypothetical protein